MARKRKGKYRVSKSCKRKIYPNNRHYNIFDFLHDFFCWFFNLLDDLFSELPTWIVGTILFGIGIVLFFIMPNEFPN